MQPLIELGGSGAALNLLPANGFPPQTYLPMLRPLMATHRVISLPPRALWPDEPLPEPTRHWDMLAEDLLAGLRTYNLTNVVAVGHSFGGVASLLAAAAEPERFRALILLDPTIFQPDWMRGMAQAQADGSITEFPLAKGASRRKRSFESAEAAYQYFKGKPLFADWPDETVRLYAESGTRPAANGDGVELVWSPGWEAYYFMTAYTDTWNDVPKLRGKLPVLALRGANTDTFSEEAAAMFQELLPEATVANIPGGHLFPQSSPNETSAAIGKWLTDLK